jgi:hypothetical protein
MYFDIFADFFLGLFIRFANTFGFTSGIGNGDQAHSNDRSPADFNYCVHFLSLISAVIRACMARAQNGCGKFQPTNAPIAIQNIMSNMMSLLRFQGVVVAPVLQMPVLVRVWRLQTLELVKLVHQRQVLVRLVRRMPGSVWVVLCHHCWHR